MTAWSNDNTDVAPVDTDRVGDADADDELDNVTSLLLPRSGSNDSLQCSDDNGFVGTSGDSMTTQHMQTVRGVLQESRKLRESNPLDQILNPGGREA